MKASPTFSKMPQPTPDKQASSSAACNKSNRVDIKGISSLGLSMARSVVALLAITLLTTGFTQGTIGCKKENLAVTTTTAPSANELAKDEPMLPPSIRALYALPADFTKEFDENVAAIVAGLNNTPEWLTHAARIQKKGEKRQMVAVGYTKGVGNSSLAKQSAANRGRAIIATTLDVEKLGPTFAEEYFAPPGSNHVFAKVVFAPAELLPPDEGVKTQEPAIERQSPQ